MSSGQLRAADKIALVAVAGILLSLAAWVAYAYAEALQDGTSLTYEALVPLQEVAWARLIAVVGILIGTLCVQIIYAKQLDVSQQLRVEQTRIREMYENSPDAIVSLDTQKRVRFANRKAREASGLSEGDILGKSCHEVLFSREGPCENCEFDTAVTAKQACEVTAAHFLPDGTRRWADRLVYPITNSDGEVESVVVQVRDVTELREAQEALAASHHDLELRIESRTSELSAANKRLLEEAHERERMAEALAESERRYRSMIEDSPDMVLVHDKERVSLINPAGLALLGASSADEVVGMSVVPMWEPNGSGLTAQAVERAVVNGTDGRPLSLKLRRLDGGALDVELLSTRLEVDGVSQVQCVVRDITERVRAQATIEWMAYYDSLTHLPNRTLFRDRLSSHIARCRRTGGHLAVAFLDLDDFKVVNDTLGHAVGDSLLCAVADRLTGLLRESDTVAHHSGDEFTIIAELAKADDAERLAERILEGLRPPFSIDGHELHITTSLGIAICPEHGTEEVELLKKADTAMYRSKEWGHSQYRVYSPDMGVAAQERLRTEVDLRGAIDRGEFELYYQPQVDVRDGSVVGVEALLRWNHPTRGLLAPDAFLSVAEHAGLVTPIGRIVLEDACERARSWNDEGLHFGKIAVNLSAREFLQPDLVSSVARCLERTGLPPRLLELEITETVAMHSVDQVMATLEKLRELDVRIAIDDFGTGYSAMSYLQRFPIQTLKIAQAFMRDVCRNRESAAIASALIDLCKVLDLDVIAEGVETPDQIEFLLGRGAHFVQGFAYCRPVPAEQITKLLEVGSCEATLPN